MTFEITLQSIMIGPLELRFYSIMILSGLIAGVLLAQWEAKRLKENPDHAVNIAVTGAIFGLIGARLYHVFDSNEWPYYQQNPGQIIAIWNGGIGIFGAIAGALFGLVLYLWFVNRHARAGRRGAKHVSIIRWFDIGAPAFLLGQGIGRWGNFFNQELFGPPTDLPWGIPIAVERVQAEAPQYLGSTHFHPLFLYESILSLMGVALLVFIARRFASRLRPGDIIAMYFIWYPAERFVLEFLRTGNWKYGALPMAQIVTAILIVAAVAFLIVRHVTARPNDDAPDSPSGEPTHRQSRSAARRQRRRTVP